jgi:hypothetical protein
MPLSVENLLYVHVDRGLADSMNLYDLHTNNLAPRSEAQQDILAYISIFYNCKRLHFFLGHCAPNQYEAIAVAGLQKIA